MARTEVISTNINDNQQAKQWAVAYLSNDGYVLQEPIELVRIIPWSQVHRVLTSNGYIYLKQVSLPFTIEGKLIKYLAQQFSDALPHVITLNKDLRCFLMTDAGIPLRSILKNKYQTDLACKALDTYSTIQRSMVKEVDDLLSLGTTPDWRLLKLPNIYRDLLSKKAILEEDGLALCEIKQLEKLHSKFVYLCEQLSYYRIPETIEHGDLHDNNILLQDGHLRISDWGEATISHPFFSLISFLRSAARNHHMTETSAEYGEVQDRYLNNRLAFEPKHRLLKALELAKRIGPIKFALSFYRLTLCSGMGQLVQYKGVIKEALQSFIQAESS